MVIRFNYITESKIHHDLLTKAGWNTHHSLDQPFRVYVHPNRKGHNIIVNKDGTWTHRIGSVVINKGYNHHSLKDIL